MKIAIISQIGHMECMPFLLDILKEYEIDIYLETHTDKHNWIDYYKQIYLNINIHIVHNISQHIDVSKYLKIFKITFTDSFICDNIISIIHLKEKNKIYLGQNISLTPYIQSSNINYIFPVFNPPNLRNVSKNNITFIGFYKNDNIDLDTIKFIKQNNNFTFNFIVRGDKNYNNLLYLDNVCIYNNINATKLINIIHESKFILSKKYISYDRFSGQLGLAMSFEKPIIIDFKTSKSYNIPGIVFKNNYSEVNINMTNLEYISHINKIKKFKEYTFNNNKQIINNFMLQSNLHGI